MATEPGREGEGRVIGPGLFITACGMMRGLGRPHFLCMGQRSLVGGNISSWRIWLREERWPREKFPWESPSADGKEVEFKCTDVFKREKTFSFREKGGGNAHLRAVLRNARIDAKLRKHTGRTRRLGGGQGELLLGGIVGQRDWF